MKIQINLELIPAPKENGTYVNEECISLCEGCFFQWVEDGCLQLSTFPKPAKIGKQLFWASSDIEAWINAQKDRK